eukprot:3607575-Alexandrium_andersonii.AAC.1
MGTLLRLRSPEHTGIREAPTAHAGVSDVRSECISSEWSLQQLRSLEHTGIRDASTAHIWAADVL